MVKIVRLPAELWARALAACSAGGRVVAAGPTASVLTGDLISDVYGVRADVLEHPRTGRPLIAFDTT